MQGLVGWIRCDPYLARVISFLVAASFTWWWNRRYTFANRGSGRAVPVEWLRWVALMGAGALVNFGVYVLLLLAFSALHRWPALAAAAGSAVAALINFSAARTLLFNSAERPV